MNQEQTFIVVKETNHLPTQGRTLHRTMKLQTNVLYRIHVLRGFDGRPVPMSLDILGTYNITYRPNSNSLVVI